MAIVTKVERFGTAKRAGIKKGEDVLEIDGEKFVDLLDYAYAEGQESCVLTVKGKNGKTRSVTLRQEYDDDEIGLEFDESVQIRPRSCANHCIFCFVDQLPKGMRDTLYIKDDDYRLSFISGSYITLTNLGERDYRRILKYKLSPLYVSVHAVDRELRNKMIGCPNAQDVMPILRRLTENGIKIHTQVVLVPEWNDGAVLRDSLEKLEALGENLVSVAVVPVGLTGHRVGLHHLRRQTPEEGREAIACVEDFNRTVREGFAFCSDEMYLLAELPLPNYEYYGDFDQIENGVGLVAKFLRELEDELEFTDSVEGPVAFITGVSGEYAMRRAVELIQKKFPAFTADIFPIPNRFFGETVTVTGLVTATDIIHTLKGVDLTGYQKVMIPSVMLKEFDTVFLDNVSVEELEMKLGARLTVVTVDGVRLMEALSGASEGEI